MPKYLHFIDYSKQEPKKNEFISAVTAQPLLGYIVMSVIAINQFYNKCLCEIVEKKERAIRKLEIKYNWAG